MKSVSRKSESRPAQGPAPAGAGPILAKRRFIISLIMEFPSSVEEIVSMSGGFPSGWARPIPFTSSAASQNNGDG